MGRKMTEYCFFKKGEQTVALKKADSEGASLLIKQGFEKQFEEIGAIDEKHALSRFADICREQRIDNHNFLAGAIAMPLIGVLTAVAVFLLRKK